MEFFNLVIHGDVSSFWIPGLPVLQIKVSINGDFFYNVLKIWIKVFVSSILDSMWFVASRLTLCQNCSSSGTQRIYHLKRIRNLMEKSGIKISWPCARKWESKWWQKKVIHSTIWTSIPFGLKLCQENYSEFFLKFWLFCTNFCLAKVDLSGNTVWPKA